MIRNKTIHHAVIRSMLCAILLVFWISCEQPEKVENLGIFGESRKQSILGQDGCTPIPIGDIMMWTFGDTILGEWKGALTVNSTFEDTAAMKGMISNSLAFTPMPDDGNVRKLDFSFYREHNRVAQFIKPNKGEDPAMWRFWAIDGIQIGPVVYVYYITVYISKNIPVTKENPMPIRVMGVGLAEWKKPASWKPGDPVTFARTASLFNGGEPVFGDSVIRRDNYLYLVGHGPASNNRVPAYMARVPAALIKNRASYEFLDSTGGWSRLLPDAYPFIQDVMGELSLSYNEYLRNYQVIYCSLDGKIKSILFRDFNVLKKAKPVIVYTPPSLPEIASRPHLFYYSGKEIFHTSSALYAIYIHPAIYQPILLKIPYSALRH